MSAPIIALKIDLSQISAMGQTVSRAPALIERETEVSMHKVVLKAQHDAVANAKHDTGDLRRRITNKVERVPGGVLGTIGNNAPHAETIEYGRKPGSKMPPKGVLLGWMRRKNIDKRLEFVLRRAIARKGFPGDHNLEHAVKGVLPFAQTEFGAIGPRVMQRLLHGSR